MKTEEIVMAWKDNPLFPRVRIPYGQRPLEASGSHRLSVRRKGDGPKRVPAWG